VRCRLGSDCYLRRGVTIGNKTDRTGNELSVASICDHVDLGAGCVVIGDIHAGDHARIGALAVVTKSVPAWSMATGNPGRVIRTDEPESLHRPPCMHEGPGERRSKRSYRSHKPPRLSSLYQIFP
jgi:serine acetyltransferase